MLLVLRPDDPRPIYQQIVDQIKEEIMNDLLKPGDELPSVRELAGVLQINMHTVHRAYQELKNQKVVVMRLGQNVTVAAADPSPLRREEALQKLREEMRRVAVDGFHSGYSKEELVALFKEQLVSDPAKKTQKRSREQNHED